LWHCLLLGLLSFCASGFPGFTSLVRFKVYPSVVSSRSKLHKPVPSGLLLRVFCAPRYGSDLASDHWALEIVPCSGCLCKFHLSPDRPFLMSASLRAIKKSLVARCSSSLLFKQSVVVGKSFSPAPLMCTPVYFLEEPRIGKHLCRLCPLPLSFIIELAYFCSFFVQTTLSWCPKFMRWIGKGSQDSGVVECHAQSRPRSP
jgi:hypothetical protein